MASVTTTEIGAGLEAARVDLAALLDQVERVLEDELYWFGVRHHSPTIARHLGRCIAERKPKLVFIEGPSEAQELIEYLVDRGTRPPVALYSSFRDDAAGAALLAADPLATPPRLSAWYPVVSYSPEYVALLAAKELGAEAVFIDLPHYALGHSQPATVAVSVGPSDLDHWGRESSFYAALARAAGRRSWDETWDSLFELPRSGESYQELRREVALFCAGVRVTTPRERLEMEGTLERERFMWRTIQQTLRARKLPPQQAMVVCGGFHLFLDRSDKTPPPKIPDGTVSVTLAPYSYYRISELSGYGAGNRAPRFYELCYEHHRTGAEHEQVVIDHVADVIKQARRRGESLSTADAISATQHALLLARLRRRRDPVLDDIHDAILTCCCKGDPATDGATLREVLDEISIGTRLGRVTERIGRLPIINDFYDQLGRLDLEEIAAREKVHTYVLDKREPIDAARSAFLHRLLFLGVNIASVEREQVALGQSIFKEHWRVKWTPAIEPALIEKNLHGETIEAAATTLLRENLGQSSVEAGKAARQLVAAIDMDLPLLVAQAELSCGHAIDRDDRFGSLADALASLMLLERYAAYRGLGKQKLADLIERSFDRACFAIPEVASVPPEQWEGVVEGLLALAEPVIQRDDLDVDLFATHVQRAAAVSTMPYLRGAFLGMLTEIRRLPPEQLAAELLAYARGPVEQKIVAGDFLHGVLRVSRAAIMLGAAALVRAVDELVRAADHETFLNMVPRLRAAFETLHQRQREGIAQRVAELYGLRESESVRRLTLSYGAVSLLAQLDQKVAAIVDEWLE